MGVVSTLEHLCCLTSRGCFHSPSLACSAVCRIAKGVVLGAIPILLWLGLFLGAVNVPASIRPPISVWLLPRLDYLLFDSPFGLLFFSVFVVSVTFLLTRSHLSAFAVFMPLVMRVLGQLATYQCTFADILAWIPYGVLHYASPAVAAFSFLFFTGVNNTVVFAQCFGMQNFTAVVIQLLCPTAPPWYRDVNGDSPADYSMPGNPGGLARVDALLGTSMYKNAFNGSPLVFGAMPSLHSGFAAIMTIFAFHFSRKLGSILSVYVMWQWWATMYLHHHYMVDLIGGAALSFTYYMIGRRYLRPLPNYPGASKIYDLSSPPSAIKPVDPSSSLHDYQTSGYAPMAMQPSDENIV